MSDPVISVEGLGKSYFLGHNAKTERYTALRDVVARGARNLARTTRDILSGRQIVQGDEVEEFWALKDVSFELQQGERLGIIGRNGAGKSTLLKLLSRITEPTEGRIRIRGRVASLLEVGTGFHPELTGRENIFLNGAILGMGRKEIQRKFDEIVNFAEVEQFLDTPVKRYSSGMYVRLAFAVAAHLEPEILIVDEVLAVGDAQFQKKCLGKTEEVGREGRTVLFVSHQMNALENLCTRAVLLDGGRLAGNGPTRDMISKYLDSASARQESAKFLGDRIDRQGNGVVRLTSFHLRDDYGNPAGTIQSGQTVIFALGWQCAEPKKARNIDVGISLHRSDGAALTVLYSSYLGRTYDLKSSSGEFTVRLNALPFAAGIYNVGVRLLANGEEADWVRGPVGAITVEASDYYGSGHGGFGTTAPLLLKGEFELHPHVELF